MNLAALRALETSSAMRGTVIEIEGTLQGIVRSTGDDTAILILATKSDGNLSLPMQRLPSWVQSGNALRVLAVATGISGGAEVAPLPGTNPELQIVAVASSSDIAAAEARYRARTTTPSPTRVSATPIAVTPTPRPAQSTSKIERHSITRGISLPSRGGGRGLDIRGMVSQPLSAEAQAVFPSYRAYIKKCNRRLSDAEVDRITASLLAFSEQMDIDPRLIVAMVIAESDFIPSTTSNKGAMGLGQLMPDEVQRLGLTNPYDPVQNLGGAIFLLKERLNKYSGSADFNDARLQHIVLALASYNAGMGAVKRYGGVPPYRETQNYVKKIEKIYRTLCQNDPDQRRFGG